MLNNQKMRTRLSVGFGAIIGVSVGVAGFASVQMSRVGAQATAVDALSAPVWRVLETSAAIEAMRRIEIQWRLDGDPAALAALRQRVTQARQSMDDVAAGAVSPAQRDLLHGVSDSLHDYEPNLTRFAGLLGDQAARRTALVADGDTLGAASGKLAVAAAETGVPRRGHRRSGRLSPVKPAAGLAVAANEAVLMVRVVTWRCIATNDPAGPVGVHEAITRALAGVSAVARTGNPAVRGLATRVAMLLNAYQTAFDEFAKARADCADLYEQVLQPPLLDMQQRLASAAASLTTSHDAARSATGELVASSIRVQQILAALALSLGAIVAIVMGRGIVAPIKAIAVAIADLAGGDTAVAVPGRARGDEMGDMGRAVEHLRCQAIEAARLSEGAARAQAATSHRQQAIEACTQDFGASIVGVMAGLTSAAAAMRQSAAAVSQGVQRTRAGTGASVENAQVSAQDLNAVAAAAEQLSHSINEISRQVGNATGAVRSAVQHATDTDTKVAGLSAAADKIGDVVRLISSVASQTNLLALNATIEAARAGEAGRGFAVVAGEVKALATQTAAATAQIASQIVAIRSATHDAVQAVRAVGGAIGRVESVAAAIAAAVGQQESATQEIAQAVQKVNASTANATASMTEVLGFAASTDASSQAALHAAEEVGATAETLRRDVAAYLAAMTLGVRAA